MPATKKSAKKPKKTIPTPSASKWKNLASYLKMPLRRINYRLRDFLSRRPHRSFRRTRRRDYVRSLKLPGYWSFTNQVRSTLWQHKKIFLGLVLAYAIFSALLVGLGSQTTYDQLSQVLKATGGDIFQGNYGKIGEASLLLATAVTSGLNTSVNDVQRLYSGLMVIMTWLTTVWLLRAVMAGRKPRLRDGIYNAGAPIVPTILLSLILVIQLLPLAIATAGLTIAYPTGVMDNGLIAMLFWVAAGLMALVSIYFLIGSLFAFVVITLPGMYPFRALQTSGDLVIGRRLRILLRLLWLGLTIVISWSLIMIPVVLLDAWLKGALPSVSGLPIVPVMILIMSSLTVVWSAAYIYIFYRKVVDDDAAPA